jgi:hypothetical protein
LNANVSARILKKFFVLSSLFTAFILVSGCKNQTGPRFRWDFSTVPVAFDTTGLTRTVIEPGFFYYDVAPGAGTTVTPLDVVRLHYTMRRTSNNQVISSTYVNGQTSAPLFILGNRVEASAFTGYPTGDFLGLRRGALGMKQGGKRALVIPANYGFRYNEPFRLDIEIVSIVTD